MAVDSAGESTNMKVIALINLIGDRTVKCFEMYYAYARPLPVI